MISKLGWVIAAVLLTIINLATLAANLSIKARADVAGMDASELENDPDFSGAVNDIARDTAKRVIEDCHVVDGGNISC
jgi:hypothetical protein